MIYQPYFDPQVPRAVSLGGSSEGECHFSAGFYGWPNIFSVVSYFFIVHVLCESSNSLGIPPPPPPPPPPSFTINFHVQVSANISMFSINLAKTISETTNQIGVA